MDKQFIIEQIKRTTQANGGVPPGTARFLKETGIRKADWYGKYWSKWGDAIKEAGFAPNTLQSAHDEQEILDKFVLLMRELKRFPVEGELLLKRRSDPSFPNSKVFANRFGLKKQLVTRLLEYCAANPGYDDVAGILQRIEQPDERESGEATAASVVFGYVYLVKSGRFHKIGKSNAVGRRMYELSIQLPEKARTVHIIETDDPTGIEAYWHSRFATKRANGEWFALDAADIAAFKRRKFM